jgi:hypothetical protein
MRLLLGLLPFLLMLGMLLWFVSNLPAVPGV